MAAWSLPIHKVINGIVYEGEMRWASNGYVRVTDYTSDLPADVVFEKEIKIQQSFPNVKNEVWTFKVSEIDDGVFNTLGVIRTVNLNGCKLKAGDFKGCFNITKFLNCGDVESGAITGFPKLTTITGTGGNLEEGSISSSVAAQITSIDNFATIGANLFKNCTKLTSATNLGTVQTYAFSGCTNLERVSFKTDRDYTIGAYAFNGCSKLKITGSGDNSLKVDNSAFQGCTSLTEIGHSVTPLSTATHAFWNCNKLESITINIDRNYKIIPDYFCQRCTKLAKVEMAGEYTKYLGEIGKYAFSYCTALTDATMLIYDANPEYIDEYAFYQSGLKKVCLGSAIRYDGWCGLGAYAFGSCASLTEFDTGDAEVNLDNTCTGCTSLITLHLREGVHTISTNCFSSSTSITNVYSYATTPPTLSGSSGTLPFSTATYSNAKLHIPYDGMASYRTATIWKQFTVSNIETDIEDIVVGNFTYKMVNTGGVRLVAYDQSKVSGLVTLPARVYCHGMYRPLTQIDDELFRNNTKITALVLPVSLRYIGKYAFAGCSNITSIVFENQRNSYLNDLNYPLRIEDYAFQNCSRLSATLTLPDRVNYIGLSGFQNCTAIQSVNIPAKTFTIRPRAFKGCTSLKVVEMNPDVQVIDMEAFYGCTVLERFSLPDGGKLRTIWDQAFKDCKGFEELVVPEGVTSIGRGAFSGWKLLKKLSLPSTLTTMLSVNGSATTFSGDTSITSVECNAETPPEAEASTFSDAVYTNATLYVPMGSLSAYQNATMWNKFTNIEEMAGGDKGDINADGSVDGNDVSILLEMVLAGSVTQAQKAVADINADDSVDGNDVSILLEMVLAGE